VGSVIGAYVLYGIGRVLSDDRLERFLATVGRVVGLKRADVHKGFEWFERHGSLVLFFGRLVPVVRSVVSIPAGAEKMPIARFTLLTAAGSVLWNAVWVAIGWGLGNEWEKAGKWGDYLQYAVVVAVAAGLVYLVVKARRQRIAESA
jgi:membrane protein DedA with SNARE-associated domain